VTAPVTVDNEPAEAPLSKAKQMGGLFIKAQKAGELEKARKRAIVNQITVVFCLSGENYHTDGGFM
jgi:hypothetical protein